jgi:hypothetical protein
LGRGQDLIVVSGWLVGGNLTAVCMDEPGVVAGLTISGIYDLELARPNYLGSKLMLSV